MRRYPAKLLLFGEYVLLLGAPALALPVPAFGGAWTWDPPSDGTDPFAGALSAWAHSPVLREVEGLDVAAFKKELDQGMRFESNIPAGYGLGSSGALCAAVYDRYCHRPSSELGELKQVLARMEGYFHGQSSGLDPLTSYTARPLLLDQARQVHFFAGKPWNHPPRLFLLDTRLPRHTAPLVQGFLDRMRETSFRQAVENRLLPAHAALLEAWTDADSERFWPALGEVSAFQLEFFSPMIPPFLADYWKEMLAEEKIFLKLCGAGGGGFVLGFVRPGLDPAERFPGFPITFPFEQYGLAAG